MATKSNPNPAPDISMAAVVSHFHDAAATAGRMNRQQQGVIEHLKDMNCILRETIQGTANYSRASIANFVTWTV